MPETFQDRMTKNDLKDEQSREDFINRLKATVRWRENEKQNQGVQCENCSLVRWQRNLSCGQRGFRYDASPGDR